MIHLHPKSDFNNKCEHCGVLLTCPKFRFNRGSCSDWVGDREEWLASPESCFYLRPVTLAIFETDEQFIQFGFQPDRIEISDNALADRNEKFTPLVRTQNGLRRIEQPNLRKTAFTWEPKVIEGDVDFEEVTITPTFHSCGYYAFFKPSIAEVLAQVPTTNKPINAFYVDSGVKVTREGEGHITKTHWGFIPTT